MPLRLRAIWPILLLLSACASEQRRVDAPDSVLDTPISVSFDKTPLDQVFDRYQSLLDQTILVHWHAIESAGINKNTRVTLSFRNVTARQALELTLRQVGKSAAPLRYVVDRDVLIISTGRDLPGLVIAKTYDIRSLLMAASLTVDASARAPQKMTDATLLNGSMMADRNSAPPGLATDIMELIRTSVDSDSWLDHGGLNSYMINIDGVLHVSTSRVNHKKIAALLSQLREDFGRQLFYDAKYVVIPVALAERINHTMAGGNLIFDRRQADKLTELILAGKDGVKIVGTTKLAAITNQRVHVSATLPDVGKVMPNTATATPLIVSSVVSVDGNNVRPVIRELRDQPGRAAQVLDLWGVIEPTDRTIWVAIRSDRGRPIGGGAEPTASSFRTTVRMPDGGGVLLSVSSDDAAHADVPVGDELVLFLRAGVTERAASADK